MSEELKLFLWESIDGHQFQALCADLLMKEGFEVKDQGVGADGGIDIIATQHLLIQNGYEKSYRWLVQTKYKSSPQATVQPNELGNIVNILSRFKADGY